MLYLCCMSYVHIDVNQAIRDFKKKFSGIASEQQIAITLTRALNDTIKQSQTEAKRTVTERYNVYATALDKKGFSIQRANPTRLNSKLKVSLDQLPLIYFKGTKDNSSAVRVAGYTRNNGLKLKVNNRAKRSGGVTVSVLKGSSSTLPFAFIQMMSNGYVGVFMRGYGQGQYPLRHKRERGTGNDLKINELTAMTIHTAVLNKTFRSIVDTKLSTVFNNRVTANIERLLKTNTP